jgi:hypothetical protein
MLDSDSEKLQPIYKVKTAYYVRKLLKILEKPGACIIKHYGFLIYGKWTEFVVS